MNRKESLIKKIIIVLSVSMLAIIIGGCSFSKLENTNQEKLTVYDAQDEKIFETHNQEVLDVFGEYVGESGESAGETNIFEAVPQDAAVLYRFAFTGKTGYIVNIFNYSNYDYLLLKDLPIMGDIRLEIDSETAAWLREPKNWGENR